MRTFLVILVSIILTGCTGLPEGVQPVKNFDAARYLGKWYEIARLDHSFERGLDNVTAEYTIRDDGGLRIINKGYSAEDREWKEAEGKAYFVDDRNKGHLKVSFFGPFYSSYAVFELDNDNYQYAFVSGYNKSYLWLLSRTPEVSDEIVERFIKKSGELGFATDGLIFVDHKQPMQ
jgi:apolipoprotein D and lipocalin family protein